MDDDSDLINTVLDAATTVHRILGPGLLESVYEKAIHMELLDSGVNAERQIEIPVIYRGKNLGVGYRADIIVNKRLLLEIKSIDKIHQLHIAQILTYLRLLGYARGYILNFNCRLMKEGIKRISL